MKQGLADAVALSPPFNYLAKKDGFVVLAGAYELFSYPPSGLTTSVKKIKDGREEIKRVIRAGIKANGFIRQNRNGWVIHQSEYTFPPVCSFGVVPCTARSMRGQTSFAMSSMERRASARSAQSWPV